MTQHAPHTEVSMPRTLLRFVVDRDVPVDLVEDALLLALVAAEALHGKRAVEAVGLRFPTETDRDAIVNARTKAGECVAQILHGFLVSMIGHDAFHVEAQLPCPHRGRDGARR